jgi:serine/threonine protein kinase
VLAGRYLLVDRIGAGGTGAVWRARDLRTGAWVAAKVLGRHDPSLLLRFVHEQSVRIVHPHVLAPIGWAAEDDVVVLATALVRGGSVADLLAEHGPLPEPLVRVLLDQTLRGLAAVHAAGVVHLDVKPANLLLEPTGRGRPHLRVADFGVAAPHDPAGARCPGLVGTDGYLAPERMSGALPHPNQDVYAAGVVAVELLTGRRPGPRHGGPNGPLRPLLDAMTEPDPARRTPSVGAALDHLRRLGIPDRLDADAVVVPDRLGDPPVRWRRRWPLVG